MLLLLATFVLYRVLLASGRVHTLVLRVVGLARDRVLHLRFLLGLHHLRYWHNRTLGDYTLCLLFVCVIRCHPLVMHLLVQEALGSCC